MFVDDEAMSVEDQRLMALAPSISRISIDLLRQTAGLEPAESVPERAMAVANKVLEDYGTDGLRLLVVSLTVWASVEAERNAQLTGRSLEALLDEMELTGLEVHSDD
jgi:hypothetical protein